MALALEVPSYNGLGMGMGMKFMKNNTAHNTTSSRNIEEKSDRNNDNSNNNEDLIPQEFLCAINGHVMKDPLRNKTTRIVYEKATIELWLSSRGSVCPITGEELNRDDLIPDDDLRNRIKRYHIQQTSRRAAPTPDDDLYDF